MSPTAAVVPLFLLSNRQDPNEALVGSIVNGEARATCQPVIKTLPGKQVVFLTCCWALFTIQGCIDVLFTLETVGLTLPVHWIHNQHFLIFGIIFKNDFFAKF